MICQNVRNWRKRKTVNTLNAEHKKRTLPVLANHIRLTPPPGIEYSTLEAQCLVAELSSDSEGVSHIHLKFYPQIENFNLDVVFKIIVSVVFYCIQGLTFLLAAIPSEHQSIRQLKIHPD